MLNLVDHPAFSPQKCAYTGRGDGPLVDLGTTLPYIEPHVYLSVPAAREIGKFVGLVDDAEYERVVAENERLANELARVQEALAEADKFAESVEYTLKGVEKLRQKPGPKRVAA